jgi:hypothetical protein
MLLGASLSGLVNMCSVRSQERSRIFPSGQYEPWGFDLSGADLGTKPGDDFFRYSNGVWFDNAVIAPDHDTNSIDTTLSDITEAQESRTSLACGLTCPEVRGAMGKFILTQMAAIAELEAEAARCPAWCNRR